jgi:putative transposase
VSRAGYYRFIKARQRKPEEMELRDLIQRIAVRMPTYGYRRITAELCRRNRVVNHKRVLRIMREDNLLSVRRKAFVLTTNSNHKLSVYENLVGRMKVSGLNQLWVADITYIRLIHEFIYLAVILDSYSRRVIGWALGRTLDAELAVEALRKAIKTGRVEANLVHHSDRGIQYASRVYTELLKQNGIKISMSRHGNPYDNAQAESFMKTLKCDEVYRSDYRDLDDAKRRIRRFIEQVYNRKRLHSALGYRPPIEFEQRLALKANLSTTQA